MFEKKRMAAYDNEKDEKDEMIISLSNGRYTFSKVPFSKGAREIYPIGCTQTHAFVVFKCNDGGFNLAIMKIEKSILRTAYDCTVSSDEGFTSPWCVKTNKFKSFMFACIHKNKIVIFMNDKFCKMNADGVLEGFVLKNCLEVYDACMNDAYLFISYSNHNNEHYIEIRKQGNLELHHTQKWDKPIYYSTFSQQEDSNNLFFFEERTSLYFKMWVISDEEPKFSPHECVPDKIDIDQQYYIENSGCTMSAVDSIPLVFHGSKEEICVYSPFAGVGRYSTCGRPPVFVYFWKPWGIAVMHDIRNDLHFIDVLDRDRVHASFITMITNAVINSVEIGFDHITPTTSYPYQSLVSLSAKTLGYLTPDGTFIVMQCK